MTHLPLTSLDGVTALDLPAFDSAAAEAATARQMQLTKPPGSLGRLEDLAAFMAGWRGTDRPQITRAQALVFAGNHGVCAQGVNPFPQEVTAQMVANFAAGGAAINQLCKAAGADLNVIALDLDRPTRDFTTTPAMEEEDCLDALQRGRRRSIRMPTSFCWGKWASAIPPLPPRSLLPVLAAPRRTGLVPAPDRTRTA